MEVLINKTSLEDEIKNLIIYKKALYNADFFKENELLGTLKPVLNSESVWKSHALYLVAEYLYSKNEKQILDNINLNFSGKKMTALVGHSGSGKSTILNLIPRFYNIDGGEIKIDNQLTNSKTLLSLRKGISLVSQDTTLFDDTIKNNI